MILSGLISELGLALGIAGRFTAEVADIYPNGRPVDRAIQSVLGD